MTIKQVVKQVAEKFGYKSDPETLIDPWFVMKEKAASCKAIVMISRSLVSTVTTVFGALSGMCA